MSVGGAAIDGLKKGRSLENVNRLRYFGFDELPFLQGHRCLVFAALVLSALRILILICQEIPPGFGNKPKLRARGPSPCWNETCLRQGLDIYIESEVTRLLDSE